MGNQKMFVITADVIESKSFNEIESVIREKLDHVNETFEDVLYTKFTSLKGDEFQAIIGKDELSRIPKIIRELKHKMDMHKIRIGIGYGSVNNNGNKDSNYGSWEFNGEAFHKARHAIDELRMKKKNTVQYMTMFNLFDDETKNEIINLLYYNVDRALSKWKEENWMISYYLEKGFTHEEVMKKMNEESKNKKERVSYTKKINRSDWYLIQEIEKLMIKVLKEGL